jgi:hypothetical protein
LTVKKLLFSQRFEILSKANRFAICNCIGEEMDMKERPFNKESGSCSQPSTPSKYNLSMKGSLYMTMNREEDTYKWEKYLSWSRHTTQDLPASFLQYLQPLPIRHGMCTQINIVGNWGLPLEDLVPRYLIRKNIKQLLNDWASAMSGRF